MNQCACGKLAAERARLQLQEDDAKVIIELIRSDPAAAARRGR